LTSQVFLPLPSQGPSAKVSPPCAAPRASLGSSGHPLSSELTAQPRAVLTARHRSVWVSTRGCPSPIAASIPVPIQQMASPGTLRSGEWHQHNLCQLLCLSDEVVS
jgi:hypothetical protein